MQVHSLGCVIQQLYSLNLWTVTSFWLTRGLKAMWEMPGDLFPPFSIASVHFILPTFQVEFVLPPGNCDTLDRQAERHNLLSSILLSHCNLSPPPPSSTIYTFWQYVNRVVYRRNCVLSKTLEYIDVFMHELQERRGFEVDFRQNMCNPIRWFTLLSPGLGSPSTTALSILTKVI